MGYTDSWGNYHIDELANVDDMSDPYDALPDDIGHYICPKCGAGYYENLSATPFCPECNHGFYGDVLEVPEE